MLLPKLMESKSQVVNYVELQEENYFPPNQNTGRRKSILILLIVVLIGGFGIYSLFSESIIERIEKAGLTKKADTPKQIHISQGDGQGLAVTVSWATRTRVPGQVTVQKKGSKEEEMIFIETSEPNQYTFVSNGESYTSPYFHHVVVSGLTPNTIYNYKCGNALTGFSSQHSFKIWGNGADIEDLDSELKGSKKTNDPNYNEPFSMFVVGDLGYSPTSRKTIEHAMKHGHPHGYTLLLGDLSYADSAAGCDSCTQRKWDEWGEMMQPLSSHSQLMVLPGNHEMEVDKDYNPQKHPANMKPFLALQERFSMPKEFGGHGNLYYSFNVPFAHVIMLNSYDGPKFKGPFDHTSKQYKWLVSDLSTINRDETPWVFVCFHAPYYSSNTQHQDDVQPQKMKETMETLFFENGVSAVFTGHAHAYERTHPLYKDQVRSDGIVYFTVGSGGNSGIIDPFLTPPNWSAFRGIEFGPGLLEVYNKTHAHWSWKPALALKSTVRSMEDSFWLHQRRPL